MTRQARSSKVRGAPPAAKSTRSVVTLDPSTERMVQQAEGENERIRGAREIADRQHVASINAKRLLSACATFATPGARSYFPDRGEPGAVTAERLGMNRKWRAANVEFCRRWVVLWVESVPHVKACIDADAVERLLLPNELSCISRSLYLTLLRAGNPATVVKRVSAELAAVRLRLRERRFALQEFFATLNGAIPRHPSAAQSSDAGKVVAPEHAARAQIKPDEIETAVRGRLGDPAAIARVVQVVRAIDRCSEDWIPSGDLKGLGISKRTVYAASRDKSWVLGTDYKGHIGSTVHYNRARLRTYVLKKWAPKRHGPGGSG